jgi:hypothetical protein
MAFLQVKAYDAGGRAVWQNFREIPQEEREAVSNNSYTIAPAGGGLEKEVSYGNLHHT